MNKGKISINKKIAIKILDFLDRKLDFDNGYPNNTTWGYAFTYLTGLKAGEDIDKLLIKKAKNNLIKQKNDTYDYPWEFIVFALLESYKISGEYICHPAENYKKKGTKVLNWQLLNYSNKINHNKFNKFDSLYFRFLIKKYQRDDGLLQDQIKTRSLQYHNFSLFILLKIFDENRHLNWLGNPIKKAMKLSTGLILKDGTCNFIGRGQEQIFGYGALYGSLKIYSRIYNVDNHENEKKIISKLRRYQREDGSIPLVLSSNNLEKKNVNYNNTKPAGWYSYNSIYDYLPFLAYCLLLE